MKSFALLVVFQLAASAATVFTADFEDGLLPPEFSAGSFGSVVSATGAPATAGLGNFFLRNDSSANLVSRFLLTDLAPHTEMTVSFTFVAIDSWDGGGPIAFSCCQPDLLRVRVDFNPLYLEPFRNFGTPVPLALGANTTNLNPGVHQHYIFNSSYEDSFWRISLTFPHTSSTLDLAFNATGDGWQAGFDESVGIDNILVETNAVGTVIPEPSSYALLGSAIAALVAARRFRR